MFYLTLPSNANPITFPENTPGKFKVRLPKEILLPESDWEVALASITFPSTLDTVIHGNANYKNLLETDFMCGFVLDMEGMEDGAKFPITNKEYFLSGSMMKYEYTKGMTTPRNGIDFWNRMIGLLNYRLHSRIKSGMQSYIKEDKDFQT